VETVRRDLQERIVGREFVSVATEGTRTVRRQDPEELQLLVGSTVAAVDRLGKYLLVVTSDDARLVVHLRMSGQLLWCRHGDPVAKHTHAWFDFGNGDELRFVDPRTFGEVFLAPSGRLFELAPTLARCGPDPLLSWPTVAEFGQQLRARHLPVKGYLLRQDLVSGLGNIYSDEALAVARLRFNRSTDTLTAPEVARLHAAILTVVDAAVAARGSSLSDAQYVDLAGRTGGYAEQHVVYARESEPCQRCGTPIQRAAFQQRSTFFCPRCQPLRGSAKRPRAAREPRG
jgi:formamidopyrimidine-DNA glycosylase